MIGERVTFIFVKISKYIDDKFLIFIVNKFITIAKSVQYWLHTYVRVCVCMYIWMSLTLSGAVV